MEFRQGFDLLLSNIEKTPWEQRKFSDIGELCIFIDGFRITIFDADGIIDHFDFIKQRLMELMTENPIRVYLHLKNEMKPVPQHFISNPKDGHILIGAVTLRIRYYTYYADREMETGFTHRWFPSWMTMGEIGVKLYPADGVFYLIGEEITTKYKNHIDESRTEDSEKCVSEIYSPYKIFIFTNMEFENLM